MLLIDIGNTRIKAALRDADRYESLPPLATDAPDFTAWEPALAAGAAGTRAVIGNVAGENVGRAVAQFVQRQCGVVAEFPAVAEECAGMRTAYRNPRQLGVDRWLAALAAWASERMPVCVIDAGTALTVDIVDREATHIGGLIAPGPELMRESLVRGTARLASGGIEQVSAFADNTADAISLGCGDATRGLLRCVAERLAARDPGVDYRWYLTGGAAPLIAALIDMNWVAVPDLVLRGLAVTADAQA